MLHPFIGQKKLSVGSLPVRRRETSRPAKTLEALPARLVVRFEHHFLPDTNHIAAEQPLQPAKETAALEHQSQTRLRHVTTGNVNTMN